ncbi:odorant receptor 88a-like [Drosophila busckii]|uniref:odorant receptor 88a-like n=1 Tax=Drosophila busckii TaxID=30019 RepID=UPI00083E9844|nr:odorant receptor 88a-like [Drosophila busckii]
MVHFPLIRDANGRLKSKPNLVFGLSFLLDALYFGLNAYDILRSKYLGVASHQNVPVLSITIFFTMRGIASYIKRHDTMNFLNELDRIFPKDLETQRLYKVEQAHKEFVKRYNAVRNIVLISLNGFIWTPVLVYMVTCAGRDKSIIMDHQVLGGWLPWNLRQSHMAYPLVVLIDVVCTLSGSAFFTGFDTFFSSMQQQLVMHFDCLCRNIELLDGSYSENSNDAAELYKHIGELIRNHQHLNSLCDQFNDIFKAAIFTTHLVVATTICCHLYLITETQDVLLIIKYILPTLVLVGFTFEICMRSTQLHEASLRVNSTIYEQNWYQGTKKYRKLMLIWLRYAEIPKEINAYGLIEVNMMHFTDMMQLAYRLFTFLKSN